MTLYSNMKLFLKNSDNIKILEKNQFESESTKNLFENNLEVFLGRNIVLLDCIKEEEKSILFNKEKKSFIIVIYDSKISIEIGQTNIDKINYQKEKVLKLYNTQFENKLEKNEIYWENTKLIFLSSEIKQEDKKKNFKNLKIEVWELNKFKNEKETYFSIEKIITSKYSIKKHAKIKYNIPQLGKIEAIIYGEYAKECYEYLKKENYIEKLKNIDQLGIIRKSLEGVHHTRWEYVVLQLYLINKLKDKKMGLGINTNIKININEEKFEISCVEIIQIWVLLLNSGHLYGTFASEKGILEYLKQNKKMKRKVLNYFNNKDMRKIYSNIIEKEKGYETHKLLIYFNLIKEYAAKNYANDNNKKDRKLLLILLELLKYYMEKEPFKTEKDKKIKKLKFIFKKIRKIAYLFLDTHYSTFPMVFDISKFIINVEEYVDELFQEGSQLNNTLDDFSNLLELNLYQTESSMKEFTIQREGVKKNMEKNKVLKINHFYNFLKEEDNFNIKQKNKYNKTLNLNFMLNHYYPYKSISTNVKDIIKDNFENMKNISDIKISIQESINNKSITLNLIFNDINKVKVLVHLTNNMITLYKKLNSPANYDKNSKSHLEKFVIENFLELHSSQTMDSSSSDLILNLFSEFTRNNIHYEWDSFSDINSKMIYFNGKKDFNNKIKLFEEDNKLNKSDENTLECIKTLMNKKSSRKKGIVGLTPIMLFSKNNNNAITDIDGFILFSTKEKIELILLESKNQKRRAEKCAREQLNESIQQMNIIKNNGSIYPIKKMKTNKVIGSYCKIIFKQ